jgi:hypothetical protein
VVSLKPFNLIVLCGNYFMLWTYFICVVVFWIYLCAGHALHWTIGYVIICNASCLSSCFALAISFNSLLFFYQNVAC